MDTTLAEGSKSLSASQLQQVSPCSGPRQQPIDRAIYPPLISGRLEPSQRVLLASGLLQALSSELISPPWGIYTPQACYAWGAHPVSSSGQEIKTICPQPQHVSSCDWVDTDPAQTLSVPRDTSYRALVKPSELRGRLGLSPPGDAGSTRQGQ